LLDHRKNGNTLEEVDVNTVKGELKLKVFLNKVLRRIFRHKRDCVTEGWRKCIMRSFIICILHQLSFVSSNKENEIGETCSMQIGAGVWKCVQDLNGSECVQVLGCCEHGNELSCCIIGRNFLDELIDCQRLKTDSAS
jgi:hypothetical protein